MSISFIDKELKSITENFLSGATRQHVIIACLLELARESNERKTACRAFRITGRWH